MFGKKLENSTRHILFCRVMEEESFQLYQSVAKKINHPDLCSFIVSIAYDNFKHIRVINELLKTLLKPELKPQNCPKEISRVRKYMAEFSDQINDTELISDEDLVETFKALADLENSLGEIYSDILESEILQVLADELGRLTPVSVKNLTKIFEDIASENDRHRELLIDEGYIMSLNENQAVDNTPVVRYNNPDQWINY